MARGLVRKKPHLLTLLLGCLLAAALGAGVWAVLQDPFAQTCRLPDGTLLRLEAVTYGTQHQFLLGSWWQRLLQPALPPERQPRLITSPQNSYYRRPALVFWITRTEKPQKIGPGSWSPPVATVFPELLDEKGYRIGPSYDTYRGGPGIRGVEGLTMTWLEAFPRRGKTVRVRFYDSTGSRPLAEFVAPNPDPGPHPTWTPEPFPITRHSGDLDFTLTELTTGLKRWDFTTPCAPGELPWSRAAFRVTRGGMPIQEWEPVAARLADATGNWLKTLDTRTRQKDGTTQFIFDRALSAQESAWKMRVEFSRSAHAHFAADEAWIVRGVPVPKWGAVTHVDRTATRQGVKMTLVGIGGLGKISWSGERPHADLSRPYVWLRVWSLRPDQRVTLEAVDDRGRKFAGYGLNFSYLGGHRSLEFLLNLPADARTLDLTIAVPKSRFVEFLAKPSPL